MTINVDGLTRTLAHIEANPKDWNQAYYRCGTSFCFAGWFAVLDGAKLASPEPIVPDWQACDYLSLEEAHSDHPEIDWARPEVNTDAGLADGTSIGSYAEAGLGLSWDQARELFDGENTMQDLRRIVARLVAEANVT